MVHVVVERPLTSIGEADAHEARPAWKGRCHDFDDRTFAPLFVLTVNDPIAQA
ncbi:MAG: hypothetical protein H6Q33_2715 [Deltaproteobacteria bacterium]|jgi:hypothetical protein|nr:hypothetical protein [Deltaproteobacteria bacterium]